MTIRELAWHACRNARDLGGLETHAGTTAFGRVVRSETVRQLSRDGWRALHEYGVATIVDLREPAEIEADVPLDGSPLLDEREAAIVDDHPDSTSDGPSLRQAIRTVNVPVLDWSPELGEHLDRVNLAQPDAVAATRAVYLEMLRLSRRRFAEAVRAVAAAPEGTVLVHCHAGKDRTGLVVALLLELAGASAETIGADYALTGRNLEPLMRSWLEAAGDGRARELRSRAGSAPAQGMVDVLAELDSLYGGAAGYLLGAGVTEEDLTRVRARLVD